MAGMLEGVAVKYVLEAMGYVGPEKCCGKCEFFEPTDISGDHDAERSHCKLNAAFLLPVDEASRCDHFKTKSKGS